MIIKPGASIDDCGREILKGGISIENLFISRGVQMVVTSGSEKYEHSADRSSHYRGDALDLRSKTLKTIERKKNLLKAIRRKLGEDFVVVLESIGKPWEHYHVHWSPVFHP